MNINFTTPTSFFGNLLSGGFDFSGAELFRLVLMRDGFSFSTEDHSMLKNIVTNTGAITYYVTATSKKIHRTDAGSFVDDGFVVGNYITSDSTVNPGPYIIRAVTASFLKVDLVGDTPAIVDEGSPAIPDPPGLVTVTKTITCRDELVVTTGGTPIYFGVVAATKTVTRTAYGTGSFIRDGFRVGHHISISAGLNAGTYVITALSALTPTVMVVEPTGATPAMENETNSTGATFSNGYAGIGTTPFAVDFTLTGSVLALDSFDWSSLGQALLDSPGAVIFNASNPITPDDPIVCYIAFTPWTVSL